ncbi:mechanosensitive ion channel family protein [Alienimonas californiensis]|uniref:mechanosensitive ion channel family protein n=1 Tax=Alienimonas californiensis TaxID=2527989 RepID=UPI001A98D8BE|nr:mechanosensitive ion channel domain-containing protein [Alienimonas californiensis]
MIPHAQNSSAEPAEDEPSAASSPTPAPPAPPEPDAPPGDAPPPNGAKAENAVASEGAGETDAADDLSTAAANAAEDSAEGVANAVEDSAEGVADAVEDSAEGVADAVDTVKDAAGTTAGEGAEKTVRLLNDFQDISFLQIGLIVAGTWLAIWLIRKTLPYLADRGPSQLRLTLLGLVPIARLGLLTLAILWVGRIIFIVTRENVLFVAGAASVAIGFAFKDYVSSLIAGIVAVFEKPYRPGDWVKLGDHYGEVMGVGLRTVALRTPADDAVFVPHSTIWTENVANSNDGARTLMCVADFYLAPDHDAERVRAALTDVALTSAYLGYEQSAVVMLAQTPWGTHYKVKAYPFDMRDQFAFISDLTVRGKQAVAEAGGVEAAAPASAPALA